MINFYVSEDDSFFNQVPTTFKRLFIGELACQSKPPLSLIGLNPQKPALSYLSICNRPKVLAPPLPSHKSRPFPPAFNREADSVCAALLCSAPEYAGRDVRAAVAIY